MDRLGDPLPSGARSRLGTTRLRHRDAGGLAVSPDGKLLVTSSPIEGANLRLWDLATGRLLRQVGGPRWAGRIAFSPDGRTVAVGCPDGVIRLWDVLAGTELAPLVGHKAAVRAVCFAADGKTLLSFGRDNQLLTWSAGDARRERSRRQHLAESALASLWTDLRGEDRVRLQEAIRSLADAPTSALPFLRQQLKPAPVVDGEWITQLVPDLSNEDFNERKRAAGELRKIGDLALPALRKAQEENIGNELVSRMLERLDREYPTREQIQALYALEAVERMASGEARQLLAELARGAPQSLLTQRAQTALERLKKPVAAEGGEGKLDGLWTDLASADARRAFQAIRILSAREKEAIPFLGQKLGALAAQESRDDPGRIAQLIADLDSSEFAVRDRASKELAELGKSAEAPLRGALRESPSPEAARRIKGLLGSAAQRAITAEQMQIERALEVLEHAGTARARQLLKDLARQGRNYHLKEAVAESRRRLGG